MPVRTRLRSLLYGFLLVFQGCSPSQQNHLHTLKITLHDNPTTLSPPHARSPLDLSVSKLLFEGLVRENAHKNQGFELALAEHFTVSADQRIYTFHLKPTLQWSDGSPITTKDILTSWNYSRKQILNQELFSNLTIEAPHPSILTITLKTPDPLLLKKLTTPAFALFQPYAWHISSGPFQLVTHSSGAHLSLIKNPHYYDAPKVYFEKILFSIIPNIHTAIHLVRTGNYHWTGQPWHQAIPLELKIHRMHYVSYPVEGTFFLLLNHNSEPLNSIEKREWLINQLNKRKIIQYAVRNCEQHLLAEEPTPSATTPPYEHVHLSLTYPSDILRCQKIAEALQEQSKEHHIQLDLHGSEYHIFYNKRQHFNYDLATATHIAYFPGDIQANPYQSSHITSEPLYRIHYDFVTSIPLDDILYNASGAVDLKYAHPQQSSTGNIPAVHME